MIYWLIFGALALYLFYRIGLRADKKTDPNQANEKPPARGPGPPVFRIKYVDADGAFTERAITPYKTGTTRETMHAYCHLRRARRKFLFSRIESAIDMETGEALTRHQLWLRFHPGKLPPGGIV